MKVYRVPACAIVLSLLVVPLLGADAPPATASKPSTPLTLEEQNAGLRRRVAALEAEVAKLDERVRQKDEIIERQHRQLATMPKVVTPFLAPRATPQPGLVLPAPNSSMPRGSVPQQFNGSTFYLVPLAERPSLDLAPKAVEWPQEATIYTPRQSTASDPGTVPVPSK